MMMNNTNTMCSSRKLDLGGLPPLHSEYESVRDVRVVVEANVVVKPTTVAVVESVDATQQQR